MTLRDQLLQQALTLPTDDQAFLAQSLEDHLIAQRASQTEEADGLSGPELLAELQRRSETYRSGQATARLASEVMADMRQRQLKERK
jgi:hypothetical protein